mgnify:CR=1 FL=1
MTDEKVAEGGEPKAAEGTEAVNDDGKSYYYSDFDDFF